MKIVRRLVTALIATVLTAAAVRLRGSGGTPPQHGGWRPLEVPDP
ncbi:hypothetical protein [Ilumatobacter sp.]